MGIDDQPFYYGGMLNIFRMRSTLVRMALSGGTSLTEGQAAFNEVHAALAARGGGTISIYYHPTSGCRRSLGRCQLPARAQPARRAEAAAHAAGDETEQAFADFEQFIRFIQARDGVRFVTATELASLTPIGPSVGTSAGPTCSTLRERWRRISTS